MADEAFPAATVSAVRLPAYLSAYLPVVQSDRLLVVLSVLPVLSVSGLMPSRSSKKEGG